MPIMELDLTLSQIFVKDRLTLSYIIVKDRLTLSQIIVKDRLTLAYHRSLSKTVQNSLKLTI
jgi:hypothetical protein